MWYLILKQKTGLEFKKNDCHLGKRTTMNGKFTELARNRKHLKKKENQKEYFTYAPNKKPNESGKFDLICNEKGRW